MRHIILLIAFILGLGHTICYAQEHGFGALEWGDSPKQGMVLTESRGRYKFYINPLDKTDSNLIINGIESVNYGFCKDKFCEFFGLVNGRENFNRIFYGIAAERGEPNVNKHVTIWYGQTDILVYFMEREDTGYFLFYNNPVHLAINKEEREHIKHEKETRYLPKGAKKNAVNKRLHAASKR